MLGELAVFSTSKQNIILENLKRSSGALFCFMERVIYFALMNRSQWIALASAIVLVVACFMPWVHISSAGITVSGVETAGTRFGKPAYIHFILTGIVVLFTFINALWAKRFNLLFAALNFAWALRNFVVITKCEAGECPEKQTGLYLVLIAAFALLVSTFFPNMKIASPAEEVNKD